MGTSLSWFWKYVYLILISIEGLTAQLLLWNYSFCGRKSESAGDKHSPVAHNLCILLTTCLKGQANFLSRRLFQTGKKQRIMNKIKASATRCAPYLLRCEWSHSIRKGHADCLPGNWKCIKNEEQFPLLLSVRIHYSASSHPVCDQTPFCAYKK